MKILKRVLIILGVLSCMYGLVVAALVNGTHWFNYAGFIIGGALIAVGLLAERLVSLFKRMPKAIKVVIIIIAGAVMIHFILFEVNVIRYAGSVPDDGAGWVVVLGAKVNGERPSLEFQKRLDKALEYVQRNPNARLVLTGGTGDDEDIAESAAAYSFFVSNGISPDRLYCEDKSTSTNENMQYAKEIIDAAGRGDDPILIVSSAFHLYRASLLAKSCGMSNLQYAGSLGLKILMPHYCLREYAAYVRELM